MTHRLLLVEDDPILQDILASLLRTRGYTVDTVDNGFGALRLVQSDTYDLIFVDYHLPEMDGYALARLIRTIGEKTNQNMKMVAITADRFGLAGRRGAGSIFDRTMAKPIEPDDLFAAVDDLLSGREPTVEHLPSAQEAAANVITPFSVPAPPPPPPEALQSPGLLLWRTQGVTELPSARVFPAPSERERENLAHCFHLVEEDVPDCFILLNQKGAEALASERAKSRSYLKPLIVVDDKLVEGADVCFDVGSKKSWTDTANLLNKFKARRQLLKDGISTAADFDIRLAAYLFVADRALYLCRDPEGRTNMPYTAGFAVSSVIESIKRLTARGAVAVTLDSAAKGSQQKLAVNLTATGKTSLSRENAPTKSDMSMIEQLAQAASAGKVFDPKNVLHPRT